MKYVESWELSKFNGVSEEPLVLVITGPTGMVLCANLLLSIVFVWSALGVGKSETAVRLAEALLTPTSALANAHSRGVRNKLPPGLLVLHGGDYSESSSIVRNHVDGVTAVSGGNSRHVIVIMVHSVTLSRCGIT